MGFFSRPFYGLYASPQTCLPGLVEMTDDERWFRRLREAELKHGRVAMLAASGIFAAHVVRMPGFEDGEMMTNWMFAAGCDVFRLSVWWHNFKIESKFM